MKDREDRGERREERAAQAVKESYDGGLKDFIAEMHICSI